jgi:hypothetical protein
MMAARSRCSHLQGGHDDAVATAMLLGAGHANRRLLALDEQRPDLNLKQAHRNHIGAGITVPYFAGGVVTAVVFLVVTRQKPRGRGTETE